MNQSNETINNFDSPEFQKVIFFIHLIFFLKQIIYLLIGIS